MANVEVKIDCAELDEVREKITNLNELMELVKARRGN